MKPNKIMVAIAADREIRSKLLRRIAVDAGFATTPGRRETHQADST